MALVQIVQSSAEQRLLQSQPGAILSVEVTDEDANDDTTEATWQWYRGPNNTGPWTARLRLSMRRMAMPPIPW